MLNLVKTYMDNDGYHIQFNVLDTNILRDAQKHPEKYRDLVVRVAGLQRLLHPAAHGRAGRDHRAHRAELRQRLTHDGPGAAWRSATPYRPLSTDANARGLGGA